MFENPALSQAWVKYCAYKTGNTVDESGWLLCRDAGHGLIDVCSPAIYSPSCISPDSSYDNEVARYYVVSPFGKYGSIFCDSKYLKMVRYDPYVVIRLDGMFERRISRSRRKLIRDLQHLDVKAFPDAMKAPALEVINNRMNVVNAPDFYTVSETDFTVLRELFKEDLLLLGIICNERVVASAIMVLGEQVSHYMFGGFDSKFQNENRGSSVFSRLMYEMILIAQGNCSAYLDLGGETQGYSFLDFKKSFTGGIVWNVMSCGYVYNEKEYNRLCSLHGKTEGYFPEYRPGMVK